MKHFSLLIAFVMVFASLSVAYADVAPYPRPRTTINSQFVTVSINKCGELTLEFNFDADCDYDYQLVEKDTETTIHVGAGSYKAGDTLKNVVDLQDWLANDKEYFLLNIRLTNIVEQTRFGKKISNSVVTASKTIRVMKFRYGDSYDLRLYDTN